MNKINLQRRQSVQKEMEELLFQVIQTRILSLNNDKHLSRNTKKILQQKKVENQAKKEQTITTITIRIIHLK